MAQTPSTMGLDIGAEAPAFSLPDPDGKIHALDDVRAGSGLLVMFICNHCPFVKHVRDELARLGRDLQGKGIGVVAINSNDVEKYPDDAPPKMNLESRDAGYLFPYLFDESQDVAKAYMAACTPDFYLFDGSLRLYYRGQLDSSRPSTDEPVTGSDLRRAVESMLAGEPAPAEQTPSIGCNIKWKPGNEPAYFG